MIKDRYKKLERYKQLPLAERKRRRAARKSPISPSRSFYETQECSRVNERIECAVNRRAAGCYVRNF